MMVIVSVWEQIFGDRPVTHLLNFLFSQCTQIASSATKVVYLAWWVEDLGVEMSGHAMILYHYHFTLAKLMMTIPVKQKTPPCYPSRPCQQSCLVQSDHHHMPLDGALFLISSLNFFLNWH